jgi:PAS domain S-box-containing protein
MPGKTDTEMVPNQDAAELSRQLAETSAQLASGKGLDRILGQREELYRTVLESLAEGLLITNAESRIIYANSRLEKITGYAREELINMVSYELLHPPEQWPAMRQRLEERLAGKSEDYEHEILRKDGSRQWIQVRATPYRNGLGEIIGTIGAISCLERQKSLERHNEYLLDEFRGEYNSCDIIGRSPALRKVLEQLSVVAPTPANVLILGESGTGKELVARAIHDLSERKAKPLVRVNCASIPKELFESEFFGHVRGAFTGAIKDRVGRFELADGGTLFLDEVGEIPIDLQSKLLRVLQEGQFERVGEERTRSVNVRLVAATNRSLLVEVKAGRFRQDLYYRLNVFPIELPPLRDRRGDIAPLAEHFVVHSAKRLGVPAPRLGPEHLRALESYGWPGNVRELQNVVERAVILARSGPLRFDLGISAGGESLAGGAPVALTPDGDDESLDGLKNREQRILRRALEKSGWKIYGADGAAAALGLKPTTLTSRIKKLGLRKPAPPDSDAREALPRNP